jgi:hypothetical protein
LLLLLFSGYNSLAVANLGLQSASEESSTEKPEKPEKPENSEKPEKAEKFEKEGTEAGLVAVEKTENKFWDVEQLATSVSKKRNPF